MDLLVLERSWLNVLTSYLCVSLAINLKVGESHVGWALVIVLLLQKIDRHLKLLKNRCKRPLT